MALTSYESCEDIRNLESSSDMREGNNLMGKGLLYGVTINLYVFHAFMVGMIDNSSDGTSVVNMLVCRLNKKKTKFCEKTIKLNDLKVSSRHGTILNLSRWLGDNHVSCISKKHTPTSSRFPNIWAISLISFIVGVELK